MSFIDVLKVAVPLATAVLGGDEDMANPLKQENPYRSALKTGLKVLDEVTRECDMERQQIPQKPVVPTTSQNIVYDQSRIVTPASPREDIVYPVQKQYTPQQANPSGMNKQYSWDLDGYHQRLK